MKRQISSRAVQLYKRLFIYVKPFWPMLVLGLCANILYSGIDAGFTYMMRPFFDKSFIKVDLVFISKIPVLIVLGISLRGLVSAGGNYALTWVARSVIKVLRQCVFARILKLPADYYDESSSAKLLSKILPNVKCSNFCSKNN